MKENYDSKNMMELKNIYRTLRTTLLGFVDKELERRIKDIDRNKLIGLIKIHNNAICATGK